MHQPHPDDVPPLAGARRRPGPVRHRPAAHAAAGALVLLVLAGCTAPDAATGPTASTGTSATTEPGTTEPTTDPGTTDPDMTEPGTSSTPSAPPEPAGADPSGAGTTGEPDGTSAVGALPNGFPADLVPLPAGAEILVASYVPVDATGAGAPYDVSLNVRTTAAAEEVMALYRGSLTAAGFTETVGTPPAGTLAAQSTYSRTSGEELLVVGVLDRDGTRTVTVGGRVRASG